MSASESRVAIVGAGAIGGVIAAGLADAQRSGVVVCARGRFEQLVVEHEEGTSRPAYPVFFNPAEVPEPATHDWILLATKAHQSVSAQPWLERLAHAGTRVAVLQNGVDHGERIGALVPSGVVVVPVVVQLAAARLGPGHVRQESPARLTVPDDAAGREFSALFSGTRVEVQVHADFHTQAWWKLMMNAGMGAIEALVLRDNRIARDPEVRGIILRLMHEAAAVGRAEGASLPPNAPEKILDLVLRSAPGHWASIAADRRDGQPMEWEVRNAVIGRLGRRHGVATPMNDLATALLRVADASWVLPDDDA